MREVPGTLLDFSQDTLEQMIAAGVGGVVLLEQGRGWVTWGINDEQALLKATGAVMGKGYLAVRMRYSAPGERELYIER